MCMHRIVSMCIFVINKTKINVIAEAAVTFCLVLNSFSSYNYHLPPFAIHSDRSVLTVVIVHDGTSRTGSAAVS